jgi:hypothetical protein
MNGSGINKAFCNWAFEFLWSVKDSFGCGLFFNSNTDDLKQLEILGSIFL